MKKQILILAFITAALLPAVSCRNPLDVGGVTNSEIERKPPAPVIKSFFYGIGEHYSGKSGWSVVTNNCSSIYASVDTTYAGKPVLWMRGSIITDSQGAEFTGTGQQIAAALRELRFRLDSLSLNNRGVNIIDRVSQPLGAEFIVDRITNRYDSVNKVWQQIQITDTIIPDGSANAYCSARLLTDYTQTLVNPTAHPMRLEMIFRLRVILQEPKNIEPSIIYINGTAGSQIQY